MPKGITLGKIEKEVERLTPKDQLKLLEKLAHQLKKTGVAMKKRTRLERALRSRKRIMER